MKSLEDTAADDNRAVVPGLAGFRLVSEVGRFVAPVVSRCDSTLAWRERSAIAIEKILAWHLAEARNRADLSQSALAKSVGRPQSFVAKIEVNRRPVEVAELVQLCAAMDQDPCELLATVVRTHSVQEVLSFMETRKSSRTLQSGAVTGSAS